MFAQFGEGDEAICINTAHIRYLTPWDGNRTKIILMDGTNFILKDSFKDACLIIELASLDADHG